MDKHLLTAKKIIQTELPGLILTLEAFDFNFSHTVERILNTTGRVIVTGMGKSGIIGKKISATLSSTGTPAYFLHPGEAYHGDLGLIDP